MQVYSLDIDKLKLIERMGLKNSRNRKKQKTQNRSDPCPCKQHQKEVYERRKKENLGKFKYIYDEFFARGGLAWFEAVTGESLDDKKIYYDITYFIEQLEFGIHMSEWMERNKKDEDEKIEQFKTLAAQIGREGNKLTPQEQRRILILLGTPSWADKDKMKAIYEYRDNLNQEGGERYAVDHIIPIKNKKVCGLNVEFNLRVITEDQNMRKGNRFCVDIFPDLL